MTIAGAALRVAAAAALTVIQAAWWLEPLPAMLRVLHVSLFALAVARPSWALILLAGLAPLAAGIREIAGTALDSGWVLEQMALAVVTGALLRWPRAGGRLRLLSPALLCASAAVASAIAILPTVTTQIAPGVSGVDQFWSLWHGEYFGRSPLWEPIFFTMIIVEGALLAIVAERLGRADPRLPGAVLAASLAGHAGAALINLRMLSAEAARTGQHVLTMFARFRLNYDFDVNAAGPVFLLVLVAACGLLSGSWVRRSLVIAGQILIGAALWMTGSRVAIAAFPLILIVLMGRSALTGPGRTRRITITGAALVIAASVVIVVLYPSRNQPVSAAVKTRLIMAKTSLNMVRAAPIFGIGVGRFLQESPRYGGTGLMDVVGVRRDHENAHNNFLQVAAEEGILGLGALLFLLGGLAVGVIRAPIDAGGYATQTTRLRLWIAAGLFGFLLTWLTSHPMLVRQAAFEFWLFAGVLASLTPAPVWRRRLSALPIAGAVLILLSAPVRAQVNFRNADLEYRGIGVSAWIHEGTLRYRLGGARFSLYMPADRPIVLLPIRREPDAPPEVRVRMYADGRLLNEIPLAGIEWERVPLRFATMHRRYVRIDFVVDAPNATGPISPVLVHVAKEISP